MAREPRLRPRHSLRLEFDTPVIRHAAENRRSAKSAGITKRVRILVVPDKFKGTLSAREACVAIAKGWRPERPKDRLELLPMSDGGDGFGEIMAGLLGGTVRSIKTVDAAHHPIRAQWWWAARQKLAVIESARVIGLAMLPRGKFHPFQLDTFGLGKMLDEAVRIGAKRCVIGIGGSATNDAGFGLARALGWKFLDQNDNPLNQWWQLTGLARIVPPPRRLPLEITVAVDVANPLLGSRGCTRVYGPQKGLRPQDFEYSEKCLFRLKTVLARQLNLMFDAIPGAGAAGGLGFGLMSFAAAKPCSGFEIFASASRLEKRIRQSDLVITGEGAIDRQTRMGKGVGKVMQLCRAAGVRCVVLAGTTNFYFEKDRPLPHSGISPNLEASNQLAVDLSRNAWRDTSLSPQRGEGPRVRGGASQPTHFTLDIPATNSTSTPKSLTSTFTLTDITTMTNALGRPEYYLKKLSAIVARAMLARDVVPGASKVRPGRAPSEDRRRAS